MSSLSKDEVVRMYEEDRLPVSEIARLSGMSIRTVYRAIENNKVPLRRPPKPIEARLTTRQKNRIRSLYATTGQSMRDLGRQFEVDVATIHAVVHGRM